MNALIVYYSNEGSTAKVAEGLAQTTGGIVRQLVSRKGAGPGSILAALLGLGTRLVDADYDVSNSDVVILMTPVWAGSPAPAINSFIAHAQLRDKRVFFVTVGISPTNPRAVAQMERRLKARGGLVIGHQEVLGKTPSMSAPAKGKEASSPHKARPHRRGIDRSWGRCCQNTRGKLYARHERGQPVKRFLVRLVTVVAAVAFIVFWVVALYGGTLNRTAARVVVSPLNLTNVADGVYEGSAKVLHVAPKLKVTVAAGRITNIAFTTVVAGDVTGLAARVIAAQSLDVDAISGATVSTKAVLKAIDNAVTVHP